MLVFDDKAESVVAKDKAKTFAKDVKTVVAGRIPLLVADAPTTGIQMLRECTTTWGEFVSCVYDYVNSSQTVGTEKAMPDWLIQREEKMIDLGYKARLLREQQESPEAWASKHRGDIDYDEEGQTIIYISKEDYPREEMIHEYLPRDWDYEDTYDESSWVIYTGKYPRNPPPGQNNRRNP